MQVDGAQQQENGGSGEAELTLRQELEKNVAELRDSQQLDGDHRDDAAAAAASSAAAKPAEANGSTAAPADSSGAVDENAAAAAAAAAESKSKAPQSWNAAERAHWEKIPAEVQAVIIRREEEAHRGITKLGQDAAYGQKLRDVISPYLPIIRAEGGDEAGAVRDLLQTAYVLRTANPEQKVQLFRQLAGQFGVDLSAAAQGVREVDPELAALRQELTQVRGYLANTEQQQHQQIEASAQQMIDAFAADPKNEFYEEVKPLMGQLLVAGRAQTMQDAYEQACWATASVRSTLMQRQEADAEAKRAAEAKARAGAKRHAGGSVSGAPTAPVAATASAAAANLSLRDELRANFRAATSS
ncbi:hypothetical protein [Burkholderia cenocepacia]|uniref:hypothetical protein n=1 Tax=Burkholderia cenocepacia TaxID=95486 RepID=UPI0020189557|nr:hypothetical protein [Burkholderia cenocepacia]MCO1396413.1 hypothetical protein [Burkholderia cenocepacia]MCO1408987.1 hypothetical protein [Burkholderia cenocepacia]UQN92038.1 hypothetical protein L0Z06_15060 [Burkholderia cenocepacia]UQN99187.1 hypothetical protein L0Z39_16850 [Burkholderia cenocepacia]UQP50858.1 hypothetical protein L0Y99_10395 [Burkholderia cenocepacia]